MIALMQRDVMIVGGSFILLMARGNVQSVEVYIGITLLKEVSMKVIKKVSKEESKRFWKLEVTRRLLNRSKWQEVPANGKKVTLRIGV